MAANDSPTTYLCLFHSPDRAESALNALEKAGIQRNTVTSTWSGGAGEGNAPEPGELERLGVPERDLQHLTEGLAQGGVLLSLEAPEGESAAIERIFHHYSANKIDEADLDVTGAGVPAAAAAAPLAGTRGSRSDDTAEVLAIPVAEEELLVGKRAVERGGVRVYRRTVEEEVQQPVSLHEEHVLLERRMVDRAVRPEDLAAGEGTLELVETAEVPVVQKTARVVEEVHVGVVGTERTEQIHDTVRHTEVEIEPVAGEDPGSRERNANLPYGKA